MLNRTSAASCARYYLVRFVNDLPVWEIFDGERLQPAHELGSRRSLPVLALLPDRFFFFFQPDSALHQGGERQRLAAARLQMEHMLPQASSSQAGSGVLSVGQDQCLVYYQHPKLADFTQRHKAILRRANAVSTPFFMAWNAAIAADVRDWLWKSPEDATQVLAARDGLEYFQGGEKELRERIGRRSGQLLHSSGHSPETGKNFLKQWSLLELLAAAPGIGWPKLRLPLPIVNGEGTGPRRLFRLGLTLALLAGLVCLGQALRLTAQQRQIAKWEQATEDLYMQALSPPLGQDPHGRLLFRLSQLRSPAAEGLDALELLGLLSSAAPPGFKVESLSMGSNVGTLRAKLGDYGQLETLLKALGGHQRFSFTLDQANSADNEILLTLKITY